MVGVIRPRFSILNSKGAPSLSAKAPQLRIAPAPISSTGQTSYADRRLAELRAYLERMYARRTAPHRIAEALKTIRAA
jgi:hypothetical protein